MSDDDLKLLNRVVDAFGGDRRPGQERMVEAVGHALDYDEHLVIQAGTGTGKSLGYLVPAMRRAVEDGFRIVVSTATLALQRQVFLKDAPQVNDQMENRARIALLKGWNNYLCVHKVHGGYPDHDVLFDDTPTETGRDIIRLRKWAEETETGDRDDLIPGVSDRAWSQMSVSTLECIGPSCPMRAECFPQRARDEAREAHIVITNHAMLGIHAVTDNQILGDFDALIVDEAHDLTRIIRSQATRRLSSPSIKYRARRIARVASVDTSDLDASATSLDAVLEAMNDGLITLRSDALLEAVAVVESAVTSCARAIADRSGIEAAEKKIAQAALSEVSDFLTAWSRDPEKSVTWVSRSDDSPSFLNCAPLDVSGPIADGLFHDVPVILTSATLQVGGRFDATIFDTGLNLTEQATISHDVGTPFELGRQGILYVAAHLPPPERSGVSSEQLEELIALAQASGGGLLALFSSKKAAQQGADALRQALDVPVFVQGDDQLPSLIQSFAQDEDSCLVGTLSLWQGIDVRGRACRLVAIDRIPFPVPSDPIIAARTRHVARQGRNAFVEVSLNHAALLMSQAAGRLLRSADDRGMIAILDSRMARKSYGDYIMRTLPKLWPTRDREQALASLRTLQGNRKSDTT
ncbi:MAG: ATP-dependent DNA helicase [Actinomycetaceae bacterium]|nr:ATP-dependent DNA helicase [Actinomycetaceae bacterium]